MYILKKALKLAACVILLLTELGVATCSIWGHEVSGLCVFAILFLLAEVFDVLENFMKEVCSESK